MKRSKRFKPTWARRWLGPYARWGRLVRDYHFFRLLGRIPSPRRDNSSQICFVVGCGRSGTTIFGEILSWHPKIDYYFEPYDRWAAVSQACDVSRLFRLRGQVNCVMGAEDATAGAKTRFQRLFRPARGRWLLEKSPINAMRIDFLRELAPHAKYIVLIRDGRKVISSIARYGETEHIYRRPNYDTWWGTDESKWRSLRNDGLSLGLIPDDVQEDSNRVARAACEWIMSAKLLSEWTRSQDPRVLVVRYESLIDDPRKTLRRVAEFLGVESEIDWEKRVAAALHADPEFQGSLQLPDSLAEAMNEWQVKYGYEVLA